MKLIAISNVMQIYQAYTSKNCITKYPSVSHWRNAASHQLTYLDVLEKGINYYLNLSEFEQPVTPPQLKEAICVSDCQVEKRSYSSTCTGSTPVKRKLDFYSTPDKGANDAVTKILDCKRKCTGMLAIILEATDKDLVKGMDFL